MTISQWLMGHWLSCFEEGENKFVRTGHSASYPVCCCWLAVKISVKGKLGCKVVNCGGYGQVVLGADRMWTMVDTISPGS